MIKILTPMEVLIDTKEKLEIEANEHLEGKMQEGYLAVLEDMFNALSEYF